MKGQVSEPAPLLLLDGAMGTELQRRGISLPLPLWSAEANIEYPEVVLAIHREYVQTGADILTTNTFRTTTWTYRKAGYSPRRAQERARESLFRAVELAQEASEHRRRVAGSLTTLEDCYRPEQFPGRQAAMDTYGQTVEWFETAGIDLLLFETMGHPTEITAALEVSSDFTGKRWLSLILKDENHLLEGSELSGILSCARSAEIACILLNCNTVGMTEGAVPYLLEFWGKRWGVYPNLGTERPEPDGTLHSLIDDDHFLAALARIRTKGASVLGACCGSTPRHIALLRKKFIA